MRSLTATIVVLAATLTIVQSALMIRHVFRPRPVEIPEEKPDPFNFDGLPPAFQTTGFPMIWPIIGSVRIIIGSQRYEENHELVQR